MSSCGRGHGRCVYMCRRGCCRQRETYLGHFYGFLNSPNSPVPDGLGAAGFRPESLDFGPAGTGVGGAPPGAGAAGALAVVGAFAGVVGRMVFGAIFGAAVLPESADNLPDADGAMEGLSVGGDGT